MEKHREDNYEQHHSDLYKVSISISISIVSISIAKKIPVCFLWYNDVFKIPIYPFINH